MVMKQVIRRTQTRIGYLGGCFRKSSRLQNYGRHKILGSNFLYRGVQLGVKEDRWECQAFQTGFRQTERPLENGISIDISAEGQPICGFVAGNVYTWLGEGGHGGDCTFLLLRRGLRTGNFITGIRDVFTLFLAIPMNTGLNVSEFWTRRTLMTVDGSQPSQGH